MLHNSMSADFSVKLLREDGGKHMCISYVFRIFRAVVCSYFSKVCFYLAYLLKTLYEQSNLQIEQSSITLTMIWAWFGTFSVYMRAQLFA